MKFYLRLSNVPIVIRGAVMPGRKRTLLLSQSFRFADTAPWTASAEEHLKKELPLFFLRLVTAVSSALCLYKKWLWSKSHAQNSWLGKWCLPQTVLPWNLPAHMSVRGSRGFRNSNYPQSIIYMNTFIYFGFNQNKKFKHEKVFLCIPV